MNNLQSTGCGGGGCQCQSGAAPGSDHATGLDLPPGPGADAGSAAPASVNAVPLQSAGERLGEGELRERAWTELLRQEAVRRGLLDGIRGAAELDEPSRRVIEAMLESAVEVPVPTAEECRRYYDARPGLFVHGRQLRARHILFGVTPGVDVQRLAARAEQALLALSAKTADAGLFAAQARELSNCPSSAEGGDLGWIAPDDCAQELAREFFRDTEPQQGVGLYPRLLHSRHGLHIVEVLERLQGRQAAFAEVRERIAVQLAQQARAKALHQFMQLLAGRAAIEGVQIEGASSPLVQ